LEVTVYGIPAYSTLGWSNWLGGDPLLNTFIQHSEGDLARLIFHELAHQIAYTSDDTLFNESFATAVERLGSARWLARHASTAAQREYAELDARRQAFRRLVRHTHQALAQAYAVAAHPMPAERLTAKQSALHQFRTEYATLRQSWGGYAGYDAWVARANNPMFAMQTAYDELTPDFEALFEREGRNWSAFYDAVRRLAQLPKAERHQQLKETTGG
jgi:predicted aminopeptidase